MIQSGGLALILFSLSQAYAQPGDAYSTVVQIGAWTTTGERIGKVWAALTPVGGKEKFTGSGKLVELSVPTGDYILQVEAPGFESRRQVLRAYQPRVFRSISLPVARLHAALASSLTGTVRNYDGDIRNLRIRLMALYGNELRESVADAQGSFTFPADEGAYILLVVADTEKGTTILDSRPVRIVGEDTVDIDLRGKQGELIPRAGR